MKAMSDPSRVRAVMLLGEGELCACELQAALGLAQSTVSRHLKILEQAGLVDSRKQGPWVYFRLAKEDVSSFEADLLRRMRRGLAEDPALEGPRRRLEEFQREHGCG